MVAKSSNNKYAKSDILMYCDNCCTPFLKYIGEYNRQKNKGQKYFFCSLSCSNHARGKIISYSNKGNYNSLNNIDRLDEFSPFRFHLKNIRYRCSTNIKLSYDLTLLDLKNQWDKQHGICVYTGWKMINPVSTSTSIDSKLLMYKASVDRIDSSKGYFKDNIQFICLISQFAKHKWEEEKLLKFCKAVVTHRQL